MSILFISMSFTAVLEPSSAVFLTFGMLAYIFSGDLGVDKHSYANIISSARYLKMSVFAYFLSSVFFVVLNILSLEN